MMLACSSTVLVLHLFARGSAVSTEGFLKHDPRGGAVGADVAFEQAMASMMGCDVSRGTDPLQRLIQIEREMSPMWRVLPKNGHGRVEWKMLRYLTHRYFLQQSSLLIRGFEPARQVNESETGVAEILSKNVPSLIEKVLEGKRSSSGFSFEDAVAMIRAMELLIFDSEGDLLRKAYKVYGFSVRSSLTKQQLLPLMEVYMLLWMFGDNLETIKAVSSNRGAFQTAIPHWSSISDMIKGLLTGIEFSRQRHPKPGYGKLLMTNTFSFEDAHEVVGALSKRFASYWDSECKAMKASLESVDYSGTGRVKLSDFYGAKIDGNVQFGESEAFLRELGALDESSAWKGKQVIIPNYLYGASNCIVSSEHYFICCVNECEGVLSEIENTVGSPLAAPEEIFRALANITTFDDEPPKVSTTLKDQLERIATTHAGQVPLHGRLFAQWLHYVFPRECPFPHKTRSVSTFSREDYIAGYASVEEVQTHAAARNKTNPEASAMEEAQLMSQWSEEEELLTDYSLLVREPWQNSRFALLGVFGTFLAGFRLRMTSWSKRDYHMNHHVQHHTKAHFV